MQHVDASAEHILHEEPRDETRAQPEDVRRRTRVGHTAPRAKAHVKREPEAEDVHRRLDEKPRPRKHRTAALLHQLENGKPADLLTPLPIVLEYGSQRTHKTPFSKRLRTATVRGG